MILETAKKWYRTRVQGDLALVLGTLAFVDLTGFQDSITAIFGAKVYHGLRLVCCAAIFLRARGARRDQPPQGE